LAKAYHNDLEKPAEIVDKLLDLLLVEGGALGDYLLINEGKNLDAELIELPC